MSKVELNPTVSIKEWRSYVERHARGTIYHLPQWKDILGESFHHKPLYLFAKNEESKICGIMPLFEIRSALTGHRLVSLPFSYICGPIADTDSILNELIDKAKDLYHSLNCTYFEIRMGQHLPLSLELNSYFSTYVLELGDPAVVWKKLHQKGVRWAIGKARRDGVVIHQYNSLNSLKTFFVLNQKTKKKLGVPAHPLNFLKDITQKLPEFSKVYLAEVEGKPIAGIITISFKDTVCYAYGASDSKYLKYHPNDLLIWNAIEESCNKGYRYFDFGKTAPADAGLSRFKKHWGTEQKPLYYYYYPKMPKLMSSNRTGIKYKFVTGAWKWLPEFVTQPLNSFAFKHLD